MIALFLSSFFISLLVLTVIIVLKPKHTLDLATGKQKIHKEKIPRIGGLGIIISMSTTLSLFGKYSENISFMYPITIVFIVGFLEDITKRLSANIRFNLLSFLTLIFLLSLNRESVVKDIGFDLPYYIAVPFSVFAFVGLTNAINIIDGINGLSSGVVVSVLSFLAYVSYQNGLDLSFIVVLMGSVFGFFIINFITGRVFLGDGGAYLLGYSIALLCGTLSNTTNLSPYFFLNLLFYPVYDTLFAIYRRKILKKRDAFSPDLLHLHSLIYKRILRSHKITTSLILLSNLIFSFLSYFFRYNTPILIILFLLFLMLYNSIYFSIVRRINHR